jgi:hypothetical protein
LEYLANSRYRLRFSDDPRVLIVPPHAASIAVLPEGAKVAELAAAFGATERRDAQLLWPPDERPARVFEVQPGATALPAKFTQVERRQVLANGLELVAYAIENDDRRGFDLTTVWKVANANWAHKFWLYNSFVNVFALDGKQIPAHGEVELSTSSNWQQGDLLVVPTRVTLGAETPRALYRLDAGVYVRFPPRVAIPKEAESVDIITFGPVRLGKAAAGEATSQTIATLGGAVKLREARLVVAPDFSKVEVASRWETSDALARDYTMFVHVYGPDGKLAAQGDGWPGGANYPTSAWATGEAIANSRTIDLPPDLAPGEYTVKVGLYDSKTMERLETVPQAADRAVVVGRFGK